MCIEGLSDLADSTPPCSSNDIVPLLALDALPSGEESLIQGQVLDLRGALVVGHDVGEVGVLGSLQSHIAGDDLGALNGLDGHIRHHEADAVSIMGGLQVDPLDLLEEFDDLVVLQEVLFSHHNIMLMNDI